MSEPARVCQFFLRGRCQRQNCEFLHPKDLPERDREREREREKERERERERARERDREREKDRDRDRRMYDRPALPPNIASPCKYFLGSGCKFGMTCRFKHDTEQRERERRRSPGRGRERSRERSRERRRVRRDDSDDESILKGGDSSDDEDVEKKIALVKKKNADLRDDKDRKEGQPGMDPPPLNPPLPSQTPQIAEMAQISTVNESVNTTVDQSALAESTIVDQHKRRAWTIKSTEDGEKDHTRDDQGFEKFEDYFSESDADESLVKPSSAPTSVIQSVAIQPQPVPQAEESILEPVLEQVSVETPPVILNPGNLEESVPGPVQDSVAGGPGQHPATPPTDAISTEVNPAGKVLESAASDPVETIAEQVVQEEVKTQLVLEETPVEKVEDKEPFRQPVVEEPFVEERAALLTSLQQPTEHLPAELLAEEEEQTVVPVTEAPVVESLEKQEVVDKKEESFEDEAPLTRPGVTLEDKKEPVSSPRRPPNKEEAAKAIAEAAKEVKEAAESLEVKEEKDRQEKIKEEKVKQEKIKQEKIKQEKIKEEKARQEKIKAEKVKAEKRQAEKARQEKLLAEKTATTPKKTAAELAGEWGDDDDSSSVPDKVPTTPGGTMSDKPKRERKLPAKLLDGAVEDTPKQHKTPKNKKLDLERSESSKKSHKKAPKNTEEVEESLENIEKELAKPVEKTKKESPKKGSSKKGAAAKQPKEDWVTLIFGENGEKITKNGKKIEAEEKAAAEESGSLELNEAEEFLMKGTPFFTKGKDNKSDSRRGRPRKQDLAAKTDAVTKIGNNMYFYTGPGGSGSPPPLVDNEDEDEEVEVPKPEAAASPSKDPKDSPGKDDKRVRTKRCNECDGCTREDCGNCEMCQDRPKFGGQNKKKQACLMRQCLFNNPVAKTVFDAGEGEAEADEEEEINLNVPSPAVRGRRGSKTGSTITSTPAPARAGSSRSGRSSVDSRASNTRTRSATPPRDEDLPEFDPDKFTPGYVPKTVKKGDDEYVIVVSGVPDTGLCGKYWGDLNNLPSRRRSAALTGETTTPKAAPKKVTAAVEVKKAATPPPPPKKSHKKQVAPEKAASPVPPPKSTRKKAETPPPPTETPGRGRKRKAEETPAEETPEPEKVKKRKPEPEQEPIEPDTKGKKRKSEPEVELAPKQNKAAKTVEVSPLKTEKEKDKEEPITTTYSDYETPETQPLRTTKRPSTNRKDEAGSSSPDKQSSPLTTKGAAAISAALQSGTPAGQQRSVSCVADTNTQREVVVECFAPYDDHRWVNIGKERDGMAPDAVQYARALRPPYHLLSFLRIKGHSTKGMSCTDKNTMVFVVLEGEITVILHTTQFNAKKGDSFYIPPKNYYNLINQKAREAELSLIQFQYDGPLPTVAPSQS